MKLFYLPIVLLLVSCASQMDRAKQHCKGQTYNNTCISDFIQKEQRVDDAAKICMDQANIQVPTVQTYDRQDCNFYGSGTRGSVSVTGNCRPVYKTCRNGDAWRAAFNACFSRHGFSVSDLSPGSSFGYNFVSNQYRCY